MTTTESFFSLLKSHRESKGVEIQEIAEYTKINPKYLHAIEAGEFKVLPNVYMRLFLRSYAQFIGADAEQALDDYELHTTGKISVKLVVMPETSVDSPTDEPSGATQILGNSPISPKQIIMGVAVILGLFLFFKLVSGLSEPQVEVKTEAKVEVKVEDEPKVGIISVNPIEVKNEIVTETESKNEAELIEVVKKKP